MDAPWGRAGGSQPVRCEKFVLPANIDAETMTRDISIAFARGRATMVTESSISRGLECDGGPSFQGFMGTFSFKAFQSGFAPLFQINPGEVAGQPRALGGSRGVGVDLLMTSHNADQIHSAAMQLAFVEGTGEFDDFSCQCLLAFVGVVLSDSKAAEAWIANTFRQLAAEGVTSCSTTHEGFVLRLQQQKPYQMFLVTARDDDAED